MQSGIRSSAAAIITLGAVCAILLAGVAILVNPSVPVPADSESEFDRDSARVLPAPILDQTKSAGALQTAVLAGGCFWGVQGVFEHVKGIRRVISGYAGGTAQSARYSLVSSGMTDHAESVQIDFDSSEISYGEILQIFFSLVHDPTELNRQGPDIGRQYRSAIFYADSEQQKIAQAYVVQLDAENAFAKPIVTQVTPLQGFYAAEDYHQDYMLSHPYDTCIAYYDLPKLVNLKRLLPAAYNSSPVTIKTSGKT